MVFLPILIVISALGAPLSLKDTPYYQGASVTIVLFYAPWCPPCIKTLTLLKQIQSTRPNLHIVAVNIDTPKALQQSRPFGVKENVPYVLVADRSGNVVKRFEALPDKEILNALIQRLAEGRLENGTLPPEKRIDSWKQNRKGM